MKTCKCAVTGCGRPGHWWQQEYGLVCATCDKYIGVRNLRDLCGLDTPDALTLNDLLTGVSRRKHIPEHIAKMMEEALR